MRNEINFFFGVWEKIYFSLIEIAAKDIKGQLRSSSSSLLHSLMRKIEIFFSLKVESNFRDAIFNRA